MWRAIAMSGTSLLKTSCPLHHLSKLSMAVDFKSAPTNLSIHKMPQTIRNTPMRTNLTPLIESEAEQLPRQHSAS